VYCAAAAVYSVLENRRNVAQLKWSTTDDCFVHTGNSAHNCHWQSAGTPTVQGPLFCLVHSFCFSSYNLLYLL